MDGRSHRKTCVECRLSKGNTAFRRGQIVCRLCEEGREWQGNSYQPGIVKHIMKKHGVRIPDWWYAHHEIPNPHKPA